MPQTDPTTPRHPAPVADIRSYRRAAVRVQRLMVDPLWIGATDEELAEEADAPLTVVQRVRREMLESRSVQEVIVLARQVAADVGYRGVIWDLVTAALHTYRHHWDCPGRGTR